MSLGTPVILVDDFADAANGNTTTLPSFTTIAGELTTLALNANPNGGNAQPVISADTAGRAWFLIKHLAYGLSGDGITVFGTYSGGTGTTTADYGAGQGKIVRSVLRHPGAGSFGAPFTGSANASTAALATIASGFNTPRSGVIAFHAVDSFKTFTPGSGFTEITDRSDSSTVSMQVEWNPANDTTADATVSASANWGSIAFELIPANVLPGNTGGVIAVTGGGQTAVTSKAYTIPATKPGSTLVAFGEWGSTADTRLFSGGGTWSLLSENSSSARGGVWVCYNPAEGTTTITQSNGATACDMTAQIYELASLKPNGLSVFSPWYQSAVTERTISTGRITAPYPSIAISFFSQLTNSGIPPTVKQGGKWLDYTGSGVARGHTELAGGGGFDSQVRLELTSATIGPASATYPQLIAGYSIAVAFELAAVPAKRRPALPQLARSNPRQPAKLDLANSLTSGLLAAAYGVGKQFYEATTGLLVDANAGALIDNGDGGIRFDGASSALLTSSGATGTAFTQLVLCKVSTLAGGPRGVSSIAQDGHVTLPSGSGVLGVDTIAAGVLNFGTAAAIPLDKPLVAAITITGSVGTALGYINGAPLYPTQTIGTYTPANNNVYVGVGQTGIFFIGTVYAILVWNRALSVAEVAAISANPWQIFLNPNVAAQPKKRRRYDAGNTLSAAGWFNRHLLAASQYNKWILDQPAATGANAVNPGAGTITITGFAPTIAQPQAVNPGAGTITITGPAPTVKQNTNVNPGAGTVTITGFAPSIAQPQAVNPGAGAVTITGFAPTILQPHAVNPGAGTVTITGFAPSIAQPQAVNPGAGTITFTGFAPTILQDTRVNPDVGAVTITGFAPTVAQSAGGTNTDVFPGAGTITITGFAPSIAQPQAVNPGAGTITITGFAPSIAQPQAVNPGAGAITFTGFAPTILQDTRVNPGAGTITITGFAPSIAQPQAVNPGAGTVAITGFAPTIAQPQAVNPGAGTVAITGFAPTIAQTFNQAIEAGLGQIFLTGFAPTVTQAQASPDIQVGAGVLTITGFAPTVEQNGEFYHPMIFGPGGTKKQRAKAKPAYNAPETVRELAPTNPPPVVAPIPTRIPSTHESDESVYTLIASLVATGFFDGQAPR